MRSTFITSAWFLCGCGLLALGVPAGVARAAEALPGSMGAQLSLEIGPDGRVAANADFVGQTGTGIPLPGFTVGIAPGEPILLSNLDLNVVGIAAGQIEELSGGTINAGAAQEVINTGLSGGDVEEAIVQRAVPLVASALEDASGGFLPADAVESVLSAAVGPGSVEDAVVDALIDIVIDEAIALLAGAVGTAVQNGTSGIVSEAAVRRVFTGLANGEDLDELLTAEGQQILVDQLSEELAEVANGALTLAEIRELIEQLTGNGGLRQRVIDATAEQLAARLGPQVEALSGGAISAAQLQRVIGDALTNGDLSVDDLLGGNGGGRARARLNDLLVQASGSRLSAAQAEGLVNGALDGGFVGAVRNTAVDVLTTQLGAEIAQRTNGVVGEAEVRRILNRLIDL